MSTVTRASTTQAERMVHIDNIPVGATVIFPYWNCLWRNNALEHREFDPFKDFDMTWTLALKKSSCARYAQPIGAHLYKPHGNVPRAIDNLDDQTRAKIEEEEACERLNNGYDIWKWGNCFYCTELTPMEETIFKPSDQTIARTAIYTKRNPSVPAISINAITHFWFRENCNDAATINRTQNSIQEYSNDDPLRFYVLTPEELQDPNKVQTIITQLREERVSHQELSANTWGAYHAIHAVLKKLNLQNEIDELEKIKNGAYQNIIDLYASWQKKFDGQPDKEELLTAIGKHLPLMREKLDVIMKIIREVEDSQAVEDISDSEESDDEPMEPETKENKNSDLD